MQALNLGFRVMTFGLAGCGVGSLETLRTKLNHAPYPTRYSWQTLDWVCLRSHVSLKFKLKMIMRTFVYFGSRGDGINAMASGSGLRVFWSRVYSNTMHIMNRLIQILEA